MQPAHCYESVAIVAERAGADGARKRRAAAPGRRRPAPTPPPPAPTPALVPVERAPRRVRARRTRHHLEEVRRRHWARRVWGDLRRVGPTERHAQVRTVDLGRSKNYT